MRSTLTKRRRAIATELVQWRREFWERSAFRTFERAAQALRAGSRLEPEDGAFVADWLEVLAQREWARIKRMGGVQLCAQVANYLHREKKITLVAAAAAALEPYEGADEKDHVAVLGAVKRLRRKLAAPRARRK